MKLSGSIAEWEIPIWKNFLYVWYGLKSINYTQWSYRSSYLIRLNEHFLILNFKRIVLISRLQFNLILTIFCDFFCRKHLCDSKVIYIQFDPIRFQLYFTVVKMWIFFRSELLKFVHHLTFSSSILDCLIDSACFGTSIYCTITL